MKLASAFTIAIFCIGTTASATTHAKHKPSSKPSTAHKSSHKSSANHGSTHHKSAATKTAVHAPMDSARATAIQTALIKSGYMSGEATGKWDSTSIAAMQKLQSDNGWQTKIVPDSRALIKLGLGPQPPSAK